MPKANLDQTVAEEREFDIYQSASGYAAVTNPVRRQILAALATEDLELGHLVRVTGKAKPTLSNLHMRELLDQKLIEEYPHPTDARRKMYRLLGKRIGKSDVPLDELRGAVKEYAKRALPTTAVPLSGVVSVLVASSDVAAKGIREQARALGALPLGLPDAASTREALQSVSSLWEREGLARTLRLDFEKSEVDLEFVGALAQRAPDLAGSVLAGLLEGYLVERLGQSGVVAVKTRRGSRVTLHVGHD